MSKVPITTTINSELKEKKDKLECSYNMLIGYGFEYLEQKKQNNVEVVELKKGLEKTNRRIENLLNKVSELELRTKNY